MSATTNTEPITFKTIQKRHDQRALNWFFAVRYPRNAITRYVLAKEAERQRLLRQKANDRS